MSEQLSNSARLQCADCGGDRRHRLVGWAGRQPRLRCVVCGARQTATPGTVDDRRPRPTEVVR